MKYGIYYAYWEREWRGDYVAYVKKAKKLGFDILEVAVADFPDQPDSYFKELGKTAAENGVILTGGYGPRPEHNLSSADPVVAEQGFSFYRNLFRKMDLANIRSLGGALYSYWPVDYTKPIDKKGDYARSVVNMQKLADLAAEYGIVLGMEVLNRFEGYLLNDAAEGIAYVQKVNKPNVKLMLDTFHMNIEEDSMIDAIKASGDLLGHVHVGEANRRPPRSGRMPWKEIAAALHEIGYDGAVVMEPFVLTGGQVGSDIKVWRPLLEDESEEKLDRDAADSVQFMRKIFG